MSKIIGIDLGTTNSVVAVMEGGEPVVIANQEGAERRRRGGLHQNWRAAGGPGGQAPGRDEPGEHGLFDQAVHGPPFDEVSGRDKRCPIRSQGPNDDARVDIRGKEYTPPEISAMILQKMKTAAEDYLGEKVTRRSSPYRPISMTASGRRPRMRASRGSGSAAHHQ